MSRLEDEFLRLSQKFSTIEKEKKAKILINTIKRPEIDESRACSYNTIKSRKYSK